MEVRNDVPNPDGQLSLATPWRSTYGRPLGDVRSRI